MPEVGPLKTKELRKIGHREASSGEDASPHLQAASPNLTSGVAAAPRISVRRFQIL